MSRIKEALAFKTDQERLKWFHALSLEEQAEVVKDTEEMLEHFNKAMLRNWWNEAYPKLSEIFDEFERAKANINSTLDKNGAKN